MSKDSMNTHNKQEELERILVECSKGKSNIEDIEKFINSEVNTVLERLKEEADKEIKASQDNLEYAKTNNQSERTIANWEGCIQGENFIKSAITALQQEYKEKV